MKKAKSYRSRQPSLFESLHLEPGERTSLKKEWKRVSRKTHGGAGRSQRKEFRPLDRTKSAHLTLRSEKAKGPLNMLLAINAEFIDQTARAIALPLGIKIEHLVNVGNHLHLQVRFGDAEALRKFLRVFPGLVARFVTKSKRGKPFGKFWDGLAYTRVVTSRREELQLRGYLEANRIEAALSGEARELWLRDFNLWMRTLG